MYANVFRKETPKTFEYSRKCFRYDVDLIFFNTADVRNKNLWFREKRPESLGTPSL